MKFTDPRNTLVRVVYCIMLAALVLMFLLLRCLFRTVKLLRYPRKLNDPRDSKKDK